MLVAITSFHAEFEVKVLETLASLSVAKDALALVVKMLRPYQTTTIAVMSWKFAGPDAKKHS